MAKKESSRSVEFHTFRSVKGTLPADLEARDSDVPLPWSKTPGKAVSALLLGLNLSKRLKDPNALLKGFRQFPNAVRLRCFKGGQDGENVCRQGDEGATAYYALDEADLQVLRTYLADRQKEIKDLPASAELASEQAQLGSHEALAPEASDGKQTHACRVLLGEEEGGGGARTPWWKRLGRPVATKEPRPDGAWKDPIDRGTLFGTWACVYNRPRSATLRVVPRRLYVLEMLRNVLDPILRDENERKRELQTRRERMLPTFLRAHPELKDLDEDKLKRLCDEAQPISKRDGDVIIDKGDKADGVYFIISGMVKINGNEWPLLIADDVRDWAAVVKAMGPAAAPTPLQQALLESGLQQAREALAREPLSEEARGDFLRYANARLKEPALCGKVEGNRFTPLAGLAGALAHPDFTALIDRELPATRSPARAEWADQDWRLYNRLVLESAFPGLFRPVLLGGTETKELSGGERVRLRNSETVWNYLQPGDYFGEIGVVRGQTGSATCVAYVHPPPPLSEAAEGQDWRHKEKLVELAYVPAERFNEIAQDSKLRKAVEKTIKQRERPAGRRGKSAGSDLEPIHVSEEFRRQGLIQGRQLMLIDLDRCTRCDECVQACVDSHADGRSRLFLHGERFHRYLVPTTCRSCRNPVCVLGCPVGSIQRKGDGPIVIKDWCIGCQGCAENCPYDAIQMHDQGVIPERASGWFYQRHDRVKGDAWRRAGFSPRGWAEGQTPLLSAHDVQAALGLKRAFSDETPQPLKLCLRHEFAIDPKVFSGAANGFVLNLVSSAQEIRVGEKDKKIQEFLSVWLNGVAVPKEAWERKPECFTLKLTGDRRAWLRPGRNVVAVEATPAADNAKTLLDVTLDRIQPNEAVFPLRAVVCDLCADSPGQIPACVHACPHEAAMRVDSLTDFPMK